MAHQVFISYSSIDASEAERLCATLESAAISCWIAPRDVPPGADYPAAIVDALASSMVMVLLLTEHAVASPHILTEVGHAFNDKKRIVPFRVESVPLSKDLDYFLSMAQWLDARDGCTDDSLKRLVKGVQAALRGDAAVEAAPRRWADHKPAVVALVALLILGVAAAYWVWPRSTTGTSMVTNDTVKTTSHETQTWVNPADGTTYAWIPPGTFTMGCSAGDSQCTDDEKPAHPIDIEKGFWMARTETTIGAFQKFATTHKIEIPKGDLNLPATGMTWAQAKAYCAGVGGRLPAEAEWEYAARGGNPGAYYGMVPAIAWYEANSAGMPHAVGGKKPNAYWLFDMLGNVSEWVLDRYYNKYDLSAPATGSGIELPLPLNSSALARGGFWDGDAAIIRVSHRADYPSDEAEPIVGFRCASDHN